MNQPTTEVQLNGSTYQIGRFTARTGSWILTQVLSTIIGSETGIPNLSALKEQDFGIIQAHCLAVCRRIENGMPMPIFIMPDRWAIKELEYDLTTVMMLTSQALAFNLSPFFESGGMDQITEALPTSNPSPSNK